MNDYADDMCDNCVTPWKCNGPHVSDCECQPGSAETNWREVQCPACVDAERAAWAAMFVHYQRYGNRQA